MNSVLRSVFPNLTCENFSKTSEAVKSYNCIAWAAGRGEIEEEWWEPSSDIEHYWPPSVAKEYTSQCYREAFRTLGYEPCHDGAREAGWEKVALYVDDNDTPTHMARQLPEGGWTSKLGKSIDITHKTVEALEGNCYGRATYYLRRRNPTF